MSNSRRGSSSCLASYRRQGELHNGAVINLGMVARDHCNEEAVHLIQKPAETALVLPEPRGAQVGGNEVHPEVTACLPGAGRTPAWRPG